MALAKHLGIDKEIYKKKLFGVFETENLNLDHPITGDMDDLYFCPNSRHAGISDTKLEEYAERGEINLLAHSDEAGYLIFESSDQSFVMHMGHFEYDAQRLVDEYKRDLEKGRKDVDPPVNVNLDNPINQWRSHNLEFFTQWIKFVYEKTPY